MSEKLDELFPEKEEEQLEEVVEKEEVPTPSEEISTPSEEVSPSLEEVPTPSEDALPTFEEEENLINQVPTSVEFQQQELQDKLYKQSLRSRGKENFEDTDLAERKEDLLNLMIEISEHENGAYHVENFIDNIIHEKGDFVDGGLYDGIDVTDLLNPLREVFPDITDIDDFQEKEDPRLVSPVADRLKEFLTKEVRKKERPFETYAMEAITQTGQTFKEIFTVPYVLGKGLIDTISKVLDFPDWVNDQPALVQLVYKMGTVHSSSNELSKNDRKTFYEHSNYYFPPANKPQTILGQLALSGAEFGLAYATGRAIYSTVASPIKSMYPQLAAMLETPGANIAVKEVLGGTLITTPQERLTTALQMMGVTGKGKFGPWVDYIAGSPDDNIFEERFKSFIDSVYTGVGLATIAPLIMLTGKGAWYASKPAIKGSKEKGKQALAFGASYFDRIFRNYPVEEAIRLDLGGPKVVKTEELRRIQDIAKQQIEKAKNKEERKNLAAKGLKVLGKNVSETSAVKDMLEAQGVKMEDDKIFPLVQHEGIRTFLTPDAQSLKRDSGGLVYEVPDVKPITQDKLPSEAFLREDEVVLSNVSSDKVAKKFKANRELPDDTVVEVRPTISKADVLKTEKGDQVLVTIHKPSKSESATAKQGVIGYDNAVTLKNVEFKVNQDSRFKIASGETPKHPAMVGKGEIIQTKPEFEGIEVTFNPREDHLFRVVENGLAIRSAEEAVFFDKRVLVRGKVTYWDAASAPKPKGGKESSTKFKYETPQTTGDFNLRNKEYIDNIINDSVRPIGESLSYQEIVENQSKYFPGLFNLKNISGENRKQAIAEAGKMLQDYLDNSIKSHGETIIDASKIRGDLEHMVGEENLGKYLMDYAGTTDALPGTMLALRQYMVEESIPFRVASVKVQKSKAALNSGEITKKQYKADLLEFFIATYKFMDVLEADVRIGGNVARALEARKIPVGGTDTLLNTIIDSAKDGGLEGVEVLEKLSAAITKFESTEQLYAAFRKKRGKLFLTFEMLKSLAVGGLLSSPKTLAAVPLGLSTYIATKSVENYISASINSTSKLIYKASKKLKETGLGSGKQWETWAGKGEGMSFKQANAYQFGMMQALLEVFGGTGYFQKNFNLTAKESSEAVARSAPLKGAEVFRTLDLGGPSGKEHEMIKIAGPTATKLNLKPIGLGEWTMAKGVNSENFERLLGIEDIPELKGKGGDFFRFLVNAAGTVTSFNSRTIMAQDGFFGTILERAEMHMRAMRRAEERLRGSNGKQFTEKELAEEYFHVVKNYPPDAAIDGFKARKVGLMQENKEGGLVSNIEKFKNEISDDPNVLTNLFHHKGNITRTYVASKFSFIRTMANIYKQTLTERGIGKLAGTLLKGSDRRKFVNDEVFRQETLAKIGTGALMVWAGYGLGKHWFSTNETEVYMEGVKAAKRENQYMKLVSGEGYGPVIKIRDLKTGDITNLPLERLDMAKAPLVLGAIWATKEAQAFEALQKLEENSTEKIDGLRLLWELNTNYRLALGDFITSLPMAQGAKDTATNLLPGFSPNWDPSKEVTDFYGFLNPKHSFLSSLRGNISKIQGDGIRYTKAAKQKTQNVSLGENWRKQTYVTDTGLRVRVGSPVKGTPIDKLADGIHWLNLLDDLARRVSWVDNRNPDNPIIGVDVCALIGPEGKPIKYLPEEDMSDIRRALEILLIPFSPQVQARSNTSDLIIAFDVPYDNPQDWDVNGTKYNLSPEQRTDWAIEAGKLNERSFKSQHWKDKILEERAGGFDVSTASGLRKRTFVANHIALQIKENRKKALLRVATKPRNKKLFKYLMAAQNQKKNKPLKEFDAL